MFVHHECLIVYSSGNSYCVMNPVVKFWSYEWTRLLVLVDDRWETRIGRGASGCIITMAMLCFQLAAVQDSAQGTSSGLDHSGRDAVHSQSCDNPECLCSISKRAVSVAPQSTLPTPSVLDRATETLQTLTVTQANPSWRVYCFHHFKLLLLAENQLHTVTVVWKQSMFTAVFENYIFSFSTCTSL